MGHTHHHPVSPPPGTARYNDIRRVTIVGAWVDLALGIAKILVGWIAHSQALIADGVHSLSDLATDFMVLFAAKHAHREADEDHPYGHGRIETVATVGLGIALLLVAGGIVFDAASRLFNPDKLLQPGLLALVIAGVSVVSKEAIFHYTMHFARKHRSNMMRANAWHSRSDAISSIVVMIGIGGTMAGLPYLDAIAAVAVGLMVAKIGLDLSWHSVRELIDTALEAEEVAEIRDSIEQAGGVKSIHMLRTRRSGGDVLVDVHIQVDPILSVSEGHRIGDQVRRNLLSRHDDVADVTVHIDPEDDEEESPSDHLPLREELMTQLEAAWEELPEARQLEEVTLHYLGGRVNVDLVLPLETVAGREAASNLADQFQAAASRITGIGAVQIYYH